MKHIQHIWLEIILNLYSVPEIIVLEFLKDQSIIFIYLHYCTQKCVSTVRKLHHG